MNIGAYNWKPRNSSILDKVKKPGVVAIDCADGRFQYELSYYESSSPRSDRSVVLDLASPLYYPSSLSTIYDRSPYRNLGTINGAAWIRLPSGAWALSCNGTSDFVAYGNPASLQITGDLTIDVWASLGSPAAWGRFVSKDDLVDRSYTLHIRTGAGTAQLSIFVGGVQKQGGWCTTDLRNLGYKHVVGVNDGVNLSIDIDGIQENTSINGGVIDNDAVDFELARNQSPGDYTPVILGQVKIHNRALTSIERTRGHVATFPMFS